jgi:hypothetical protein
MRMMRESQICIIRSALLKGEEIDAILKKIVTPCIGFPYLPGVKS